MTSRVGRNAEEQEDEFQYLWGGMDQVGGDWDFDALNEEVGSGSSGVWNTWDEPPALNTTFANEPSSSSSRTLPSLDSLFDRQAYTSIPRGRVSDESPFTTSSSRMGNAVSSATTAFYSPTRPSDPNPFSPLSADARARLTTTTTGNATDRRLPQPSSFGYYPSALRPPSDSTSFDGVHIDDLLASDVSNGDDEMPRPRHEESRRGRGRNIVDLTTDTSPFSPSLGEGPSSSRHRGDTKRSAPEDLAAREDRRAKRRRHSHSLTSHLLSSPTALPTTTTTTNNLSDPIEEYDLTNDDREEQLLQAQQQAAIAAQQAISDQNSTRQRIGQRQCIICMEPFTNVTITHCGHVYCHECLTQALLAGEKVNDRGTANCPVCRKPVKRTKANQVIPLSFMTKAEFRGKQRA